MALVLAAALIVGALAGGQETASEAAVRLTQQRAAALMAGDGAALADVTVPGSAAARADRVALLAATPARPWPGAPEGASAWDVDVVAEEIVPCEAHLTCVTVRTVTSWGGIRGAGRRVVLVLEPEPWRVLRVSDAG